MADIIQFRRGSAAAWELANPVLADGEMGFERDTGRKKIGNGMDVWSDLPYDTSGATSTDELPEGVTNLYFDTDRVLNTQLAGLDKTSGTEIEDTDSVLSAFGRLQKQIKDFHAPSWGTISGALTDQTDLTAYIASQTANGNTAYGWGNHALAGYLTSIPANTTLMGNTFNGADQLVKLDGDGKLPAVDGSLLTNLPGGLPSQTGNADKWLTTNGTVASWAVNTGWSTGGNALTDPSVNFLGTSDNKDMVFKVNGAETMRLVSGGNVQFGYGFTIKQLTGADNGANRNLITYRRDLGQVTFPILSTGSDWNTIRIGTRSSSSALQVMKDGIASSGMPVILNDNDGSSGFVKQGAVFPGLNLYSAVGGGEPTLAFWEPFSSYHSCKGVISGKRNTTIGSAGAGRAGDLIFYTSDGSSANPSSYLKEVMRLTAHRSILVGQAVEDLSAIVNINSTTKGFLPPRMTTSQRDAIASPAEGLVIYNTTTKKLNLFTTAWEQVTST